jgi:SAM-dependent methyltransferase
MVGDHFSSVAAKYAECRPSYPGALVSYLAALTPAHRLAWDCGTGSGQAAVLLAAHFARVVATDASDSQLQHAVRHPRIEYRRGSDADSGLDAACCDLVSAAQAAHWFDLPAFYAEVDRVLVPHGVLALWGYASIEIAPDLDPLIRSFEHERVGQYWPSGRERATDRYRNLPFPYSRLDAPEFVMERRWTSAEFLDYVRTWSAVDRCRAAEGVDPVNELAAPLGRLWGPFTRDVRWPLHMLVGRKPGQ